MTYSLRWLEELTGPLPMDAERLLGALSGIGLLCEESRVEGDDFVFGLEITANRGDLLSMRGLAFEIGALLGLPAPSGPSVQYPGESAVPGFRVVSGDPADCPFYSGTLLSGLAVGASDAPVAARLESLGVRPVNNVVDITNSVMLELGQPLHAFDAARISGGIEVRRARPGETLVTIDNEERRLGPGVLVIADREKVLALAGIMGGRDSEVTTGTRDVFLESAFFTPSVVRAGKKFLGMESDAAARFERRVDPEMVLPALGRAASLVASAAGGRVAGHLRQGALPAGGGAVTFRPSKIRALLGVDIDPDTAGGILNSFGCRVRRESDECWQVETPPRRGDLGGEADLVEEVARFSGYDRIPALLPRIQVARASVRRHEERLERTRDYLVKVGFDEVVSSSFLPAGEGPARERVRLANPLAADQDALRDSLLPSLAAAGALNESRGNEWSGFFEVGGVFRPAADKPAEDCRIALLAPVSAPPGDSRLFLKSVLLELAGLLGLEVRSLGERPLPYLERSVALFLDDGACFAAFGGVRSGKCFFHGAEIYRPGRPGSVLPPPRFMPWPKFPAVKRDYSFLVPDGVTWEEVEGAIRGASGLVASLSCRGRYRSGDLPPGFSGLTVSVSYRSPERTLTGREADRAQEMIVAGLDGLGLKLREKPSG